MKVTYSHLIFTMIMCIGTSCVMDGIRDMNRDAKDVDDFSKQSRIIRSEALHKVQDDQIRELERRVKRLEDR